jgi:glutaredoxin
MVKYLTYFIFLISCSGLYAADPYKAQHTESAAAAILYYHPNCIHCKTVIKYLNQQNKSVQMRNTSNPEHQAELRRLGQRGVPVLVAGSKVLVGSDQIINYLKEHPEAAK